MAGFKSFLALWLTAIWFNTRYSLICTGPRWMSIVLCLAPVLLWTAWCCVVYPRFFSALRSLPQAAGGSLLTGHFLQMRREPTGDPLRAWMEQVPNDGLIRYGGLLNSDSVAVVGPEALAEVLVHKNYEFIKPPGLTKGIGGILGVGLFLAEGEEHKRQRKNLMPAFAFRHIKDLYPVFWTKSQELIQALSTHMVKAANEASKPENSAEASKTSADVGHWASRVTLDIIGVAGLGQDFNAIQNPESPLNVTYRTIFSPSRSGQILAVLGFILPRWLLRSLPINRNKGIRAASGVIKDTCRSLIANKKQTMNDEKEPSVDILSVALKSEGFSDEDLVNQLMTFLIAGHETTAAALSWAINMLCRHPSMQTRLREEVRANLPDPRNTGDSVSATEIDKLPYLHAVCNEIFRLFPPVPMTVRVAARDTSIPGHYIPKGTDLVLVPWATNTDKAHWGEDATQFNPERWLRPGMANTGGAESNYSFLTFLHGPRSCIGSAFARGEFACLLAAWAGAFEIEYADGSEDVKIKNGITARPGGLEVQLRQTKRW